MATITWIGLGQMGRPMAASLANAGHDVRGIEIDAAAAAEAADLGVTIHSDLASAVRGSDFVFTMLFNGDQVADVLTRTGGVFDLAEAETVVIDCSTIDVTQVRELHAEAERRAVRFLDAPVSGGVSGAASATLTIMVGGEDPVFGMAQRVLEDVGSFVVHLGGPGTGQAAKIVNNMILGICLAATCEGVVLAEQLGLDTKTLYEVVTRSSGDNWALRKWYPVADVVSSAASCRDFAPGFTTSLLVKDLTLALKAGEATGSPLETAQIAHRLFTDHRDADGALLDCSSLVTALRAGGINHSELEAAR
jgi:3-hydroxyisobutyrate dehydrogenase